MTMVDCAEENIYVVNDSPIVDKPGELCKRKRSALADLNPNVDFSDRNEEDDKKLVVYENNNNRESPERKKRNCYFDEEDYLNSSSSSVRPESRLPHSSGYVSDYLSSDDDFDDSTWLNVESEASVYSGDILKNMMIWKDDGLTDSNYFDKHPALSVDLRTGAVIWLVETVDKMEYHPTTMFRAVSYLDRYLSSVRAVGPEGLTLVTAGSLLLAAKMEETVTPGLTKMACLVPGKTTVEDMGVAERRMVSVLEYRLSLPTSFTFLMHIVAVSSEPATTVFLAMYILELSLLQGPPYIGVEPSLIACASLALARSCMGVVDAWSRYLIVLTGYSQFAIGPVSILLHRTLADAPSSFPAITEKYSSQLFLCVATVSPRQFQLKL